ncbi:hypothetical protein GIB67_016738 [Kingdonia uniflora]|uniref:Uncharacterized protein n=1 Tax=Kingdonia uniflora TaxID=39325 RepID=A0A7J7LMF0_9MAGN|nr:hypothetical protein GIB67_016738 [Kingdonia uniflora]
MDDQNMDFFRSLSHKELQRMCKELGLPARKSSSFLAMSLASYFQANTVGLKSSNENSSVPMEVLPRSSPIMDLNFDAQGNSIGGSGEGHERRVEAAYADGCGPSPCLSNMGYDKGLPQTVNNNKSRGHAEGPISHLVSAVPENMVFEDPSNNRIVEGFQCSNYNTQEIILPPQSVSRSKLTGIKFKSKEPSSSNEVRNPCQNSVVLGSSGSENKPKIPSFQFYVGSEEGINLIVDLNSSPSDWIKGMKDAVCIESEPQDSDLIAPHSEFENLEDSDERMQFSPLGNTQVGSKTSGHSSCVKSSAGLITRDRCHPFQIDCSLRPMPLMPITTSVEVSGNVEEIDRNDSSLCKVNCDVRNKRDCITESFPRNCITESSPRNCERVNCDLEVPADLEGEPKFQYLTKNQLKSCSISENTTEANSVGISIASNALRPPFSREINETITPITGANECTSEIFRGYPTTGSVCMPSSEHCEETRSDPPTSYFPCQNGEYDLFSMESLQNANGESTRELAKSPSEPLLSACHEV